MLKTLSYKQIKASPKDLKVIKSSVTLLLSLVSRIGSVSQDNQQVDKLVLMKKTALETMHNVLTTWIKRVVGSTFGGMPSTAGKLKLETKVCNFTLYISTIASCSYMYK